MKQYSTVIFDLDGTLLDTKQDLADSVNHSMWMLGYPKHSLEELSTFLGSGAETLVAHAMPGGRANNRFSTALQVFKQHFSHHGGDKTVPYDEVNELVETLSQRGVAMAMLSHEYDSAIKTINKRFFGTSIPVALGEVTGLFHTPEPASIEKALELLGVPKETAVYVGDGDRDVEMARDAGVDFIGCSWGFRGRSFLEANGAELIIDHPLELLQYVKE